MSTLIRGAAFGIILHLATVAVAAESKPDDTQWHDAAGLTVEGRGWVEADKPFVRLPAKAEGVVPDAVWKFSRHSTGVCVRFVTDAPKISARWTPLNPSMGMNHMAGTGMDGVDLYVKDAGRWRWLGVGRPRKADTQEEVLAQGIPSGTREYLLYLPLYNGVKSVEIGVPQGAKIEKAPARTGERARPICVYGTSIVHGGCASRPGMAHVAILGRKLDWPMLNIGFSGSGKMELALAELLAELDPAVYVLDCLPNMTTEMVKERVEPFVVRLHEARPKTPIILVENILQQHGHVLPGPRKIMESKNAALRDAAARLKARGIDVTVVPGEPLLGDDGEGTVDGTHPTDLGFLRMAEALEPVLRQALGI